MKIVTKSLNKVVGISDRCEIGEDSDGCVTDESSRIRKSFTYNFL